MSKNKKTQPVARIKFGRVRASIWENKAKDGSYHTVTFDRFYRDRDGKPRNSNSFAIADLLLLAKVADQAHTSICQNLNPDSEGSTDESTE